MEFFTQITKLDCLESKDNFTNVVKRIHCSIIGRKGQKERMVNIIVDLSLDTINSSNFIEYKNLSEDIVNTWLPNLSDVKESIEKTIDEDQNSEINLKLPWI